MSTGTIIEGLLDQLEKRAWSGKGMGWGALLGGGLGGLLGMAAVDPPDIPENEQTTWWKRGLVGAGMGAAAGGTLGYFGDPGNWKSVTLPNPSGRGSWTFHKGEKEESLRDNLQAIHARVPGGTAEVIRNAQLAQRELGRDPRLHKWKPADINQKSPVSYQDMPPELGGAAIPALGWIAVNKRLPKEEQGLGLRHELRHNSTQPRQFVVGEQPLLPYGSVAPRNGQGRPPLSQGFSSLSDRIDKRRWDYFMGPREFQSHLGDVKDAYLQGTGKHIVTEQDARDAVNWYLKSMEGKKTFGTTVPLLREYWGQDRKLDALIIQQLRELVLRAAGAKQVHAADAQEKQAMGPSLSLSTSSNLPKGPAGWKPPTYTPAPSPAPSPAPTKPLLGWSSFASPPGASASAPRLQPPAPVAGPRPMGIGQAVVNGTTGLLGGTAAAIGGLGSLAAAPFAWGGEKLGILPKGSNQAVSGFNDEMNRLANTGMNQFLHNTRSTAFSDRLGQMTSDLAQTSPGAARFSQNAQNLGNATQNAALLLGTQNLRLPVPGNAPGWLQTGLRWGGRAQQGLGAAATAATAADVGMRAGQAVNKFSDKMNDLLYASQPLPQGRGIPLPQFNVNPEHYGDTALRTGRDLLMQQTPWGAQDPFSKFVGNAARDYATQAAQHGFYREPGLLGKPRQSGRAWMQPLLDAAAYASFSPMAIGARSLASGLGREQPPNLPAILKQRALEQKDAFLANPKSVGQSPFLRRAVEASKTLAQDNTPWAKQLASNVAMNDVAVPLAKHVFQKALAGAPEEGEQAPTWQSRLARHATGEVAGSLAATAINRLQHEGLQGLAARVQNLTPEQLQGMRQAAKLPERLKIRESALGAPGNAFYRPTESFPTARAPGEIIYDPKLFKPGIMGHEMGHANIQLGGPTSLGTWAQNLGMWGKMSPHADLLANVAAQAANERFKNPLVGGAVGGLSGLAAHAPQLWNEAQATRLGHTYAQEAGIAPQQQELNQELMRRAWETYLNRAVTPHITYGAVTGLGR